MSGVQFYEEQRANKPLIWVLALFAPGLMTLILFYQLITGIQVGNRPTSNTALAVMIVSFGLPAVLLVTRVKLTTMIDEEKIAYGFNFPTPDLNVIRLSDIKECYLTQYRFAGFGYHLTRRYGLVYNISGRKGIQIIKHSGEKILIGTQKWDELKSIFESRPEKPADS